MQPDTRSPDQSASAPEEGGGITSATVPASAPEGSTFDSAFLEASEITIRLGAAIEGLPEAEVEDLYAWQAAEIAIRRLRREQEENVAKIASLEETHARKLAEWESERKVFRDLIAFYGAAVVKQPQITVSVDPVQFPEGTIAAFAPGVGRLVQVQPATTPGANDPNASIASGVKTFLTTLNPAR